MKSGDNRDARQVGWRQWMRSISLSLCIVPLVLWTVMEKGGEQITAASQSRMGSSVVCKADKADTTAGDSMISSGKVLGISRCQELPEPLADGMETLEAMLTADEETQVIEGTGQQQPWHEKADRPVMAVQPKIFGPRSIILVILVLAIVLNIAVSLRNWQDHCNMPAHDEKKQLAEGIMTNEATDMFSCTPLHLSAHRRSETTASALLAARAEVDARDAWDETPLHFAARSGSTEVCKLLLHNKAEINVVNESGTTPLVEAAKCGNELPCTLLLDHGGHAGGMAEGEIPPMLANLLAARIADAGQIGTSLK